MIERRRLERFDLTAPARLIVEAENGEKTQFNLTTKDVSSSGAFLSCLQPLFAGMRVKMELLICLDSLQKIARGRGRTKVRVKGTIIRVEKGGVAIRFESKYKITALDNSNHEIGVF